jgi:hypothetical protein
MAKLLWLISLAMVTRGILSIGSVSEAMLLEGVKRHHLLIFQNDAELLRIELYFGNRSSYG